MFFTFLTELFKNVWFPRSVTLRGHRVHAVWHCADTVSTQCDTARTLCPRSVTLRGHGVPARVAELYQLGHSPLLPQNTPPPHQQAYPLAQSVTNLQPVNTTPNLKGQSSEIDVILVYSLKGLLQAIFKLCFFIDQ